MNRNTIYIFLLFIASSVGYVFILLAFLKDRKPVIPPDTHCQNMNPVTTIHYMGALETEFIKYGLVDIQSLSSRFFVKLDYSDTANFIHKDVYGSLEKCYLHKETSAKLMVADSILKAEFPFYHFLIFDGADRKSTRLNSSHIQKSRMPSSA